MDHEADLMPSSPSNTSISSSDLDTESTGSFFHDRSTTLGTLMGVTFPDVGEGLTESRTPSGLEHARADVRNGRRHWARAAAVAPLEQRRRRRCQQLQGHKKGRRAWWRLCRDDVEERTSLGEYLQVERGLSGEAGDGVGVASEHEAIGGGPLFAADGRVLPPASARAGDMRRRQRAYSVGRMPMMLFTGICSGGEG